jgi:hypothetical protein
MKIKKITKILIIILIISIISGCIFHEETIFNILSSEIIDDDGFPSLKIGFNVNEVITVKLINPNNQEIIFDKLYSCQNELVIPLDSYLKNPQPGNYKFEVYDKNNNIIYNKVYNFRKADLSIISIEGQWWKENKDYSLIGIIITIKNNGDLPLYPYSLDLTIDDKSTSALILPTAVLPEETKTISCYLDQGLIIYGKNNYIISIYDENNNLLIESSQELVPEENVLIQNFNWDYNGKKEINIPLPQFLHDYYSELDRPNVNDYGSYVLNPYDDPYLSLIKDSLLSTVGDIDDVSKINLIASFVQSLDYQEDDPQNISVEYPRYPIELLDKKPCDCEDKAILAGNILMLMGYNVSLLDIPYHMVVGVHLDENLIEYDYYIDEYYYLETTNKGRTLGQFYNTPRKVTVYPLTSRPLLHQEWKKAEGIVINGRVDYVKLKLVVENLGNIASDDIKITSAFYSSEDKEYNLIETNLSSIKPGEKKQLDIQLTTPHGISTILKTQIYMNGIFVEEKESETKFL